MNENNKDRIGGEFYIKIGRFIYSMNVTGYILVFLVVLLMLPAAAKILPMGILAGPVAVFFGLLLLFSILLHEAGHSYVAEYFGIHVKEITIFALGGLSIMEDRPKKALHEFCLAIAGPIVSLIIYNLCSIPHMLYPNSKLAYIINELGFYNLLIAIFNLVPAFPLDGGRVFRALLWSITSLLQATIITARIGQLIAIGYGIYSIIMIPSTYGISLFNILICLFIFFAADAELKALKKEYHIKSDINQDKADA